MHNNYKKLAPGTKKHNSKLSINGHILIGKRAEYGIKSSKMNYNYQFF